MITWIVNEFGELGVLLNDQAFFMYKGEAFQYETIKYREVEKREFGESGPNVNPQVEQYDWKNISVRKIND